MNEHEDLLDDSAHVVAAVAARTAEADHHGSDTARTAAAVHEDGWDSWKSIRDLA